MPDGTRAVALESFDLPDVTASAEPSEDWRAGFAEGQAQAIADAAAAQDTLSADLVQCLSDMAFGYREARDHVCRSLGPLFTTLIERLVPTLARDMLGPHLIDALARAAEADAAAPVTIALSPTQCAAVAPLLDRHASLPLRIVADPSLSSGQAMILRPETETVLDLDAVTAGTRAILSALLDSPEQRLRHG